MFCIDCGKELPKTAIYCPFCGSYVEDYNKPIIEKAKQPEPKPVVKSVAKPEAKPIQKPESTPGSFQKPEVKAAPKPEEKPEPKPEPKPVPKMVQMAEMEPESGETMPAPTTAEKAKDAVFVASSALGSFSRSRVQSEDAITEGNSDEWVTWVPDPSKRRH